MVRFERLQIERLQIKGFRRLYDIDVALRPLCVVIGPNGSGKTSLLDVFSILSASASGTLDKKLSEFGGLNAILTAKLASELEEEGAHLDAIYFCAHHPTVGEAPYRLDCDCRKPRPGLILRAANDFDIDLGNSWMVGDRYSDIELAHNAGVRSAFVMSGYGRGEWEFQRANWRHRPDLIGEDLFEIVQAIVAMNGQTAGLSVKGGTET